MADQFCLRWNNFQSNIVNALDSLKCSEDLVDVTLTCEGRNIKAHKVILSACSPYFRNVFKENPCQHPVIILKDVSADDIVSLLSYMYQGEVFIEESKLSSFLHTAALLQVKGLTGVTQARDNFSSPTTSNKLFTQLTISPKAQLFNFQKMPGLNKRRSSTSDKPNDITIANGQKKSRLLDTLEPNPTNTAANPVREAVVENNNDKKIVNKTEITAVSNGKSSIPLLTLNAQGDNIPVTIKSECSEDRSSPTPPSCAAAAANDDELVPDYENSMLARSLLSGINPLKSDMNANNNNIKKTLPKLDSRLKDTNGETPYQNAPPKSPLKVVINDEMLVKSEKQSPKSDIDYEPEILLSEQQDSVDADGPYSQDPQQSLLILAGMSNSGAHSGALNSASTSQGISHQQSNHAAICGDCPHCGMKYSNQSALKYHVRLMHSDLTNRLCCYLCPRSFTMRETFKEHMWTTHGQRN